MPFFGVPIRNGLPIGLGSVAGFGVQRFDPSELFYSGAEGAWYDPSDLSTLFQDTAGTTPAVMPGGGSAVPVGMMLDKSQGLVLGPELVTNGTFDTDTGWTKGVGWTISGGAAQHSAGTASTLDQVISLVAGTAYKITIDATASGGTWSLQFAGGTTTTVGSGLGSGSLIFIGFAATGNTTLRINAGTSTILSVDNISVKELPGNHAISYNTTTARPELSARVNLLTYSEQFDNAVWAVGSPARVTISTNQTTAPDGTNTADLMTETTTNSTHRVFYDNVAGSSVLISNKLSCFYKQNTGNAFALLAITDSGGTNQIRAWFNLQTGAVGTIENIGSGSGAAATITPANSGFWHCSISGITGGTGTCYVFVGMADADGSLSYTGSTGRSVFIWGADLRPANIGANVPAYQRIAAANTYDTNGFPLYLRFDGSDDAMYTPANLDLTSTDNATVFAGVRKLSDAVIGVVAELSADWFLNNGSFALAAPNTVAANYGWNSRGSLSVIGTTANAYAAPDSAVLAGSAEIGTDTLVLRRNGTQVMSVISDQGTGNYGTYPLYIGSRAGTSLRFNGYLYGLTVVGSQLTTPQIESMESWTAGKTGISIP